MQSRAAKRHYRTSGTHNLGAFLSIQVKSYKGVDSSGSVQITGGDLAALAGRNVLLVEDIIDTGVTVKTRLSHASNTPLFYTRPATLTCGFY